jgi:hypothetical protein
MKSNIQFKIFILLILIIIPISILYFNLGEDLFINNKENFKNYINICNPTKGHFYNLNSATPINNHSVAKNTIYDCRALCDVCNCDLYLFNDSSNTCNIYNIADNNFDFSVNCNNKPLPTSFVSSYLHGEYLGEGNIDRNFYLDNKNKFNHINYLFDEAQQIVTYDTNINNQLDRIKNLIKTSSQDDINSERGYVDEYYRTMHSKINNLASHLDLSQNFLYSDFVDYFIDSSYTIEPSSNFILGNKDFSHNEMMHEFDRLYDESKNLDAKTDNNNLEYNRKYLVYTILTILMIISVIILIAYKLLPNLIKDSFIISYFIGVLLLVFFIHNYFKV